MGNGGTTRYKIMSPHGRIYKIFGMPQNLGEFAHKMNKKGEKSVNFILSSYTETTPITVPTHSSDPFLAGYNHDMLTQQIFVPQSEKYKSSIVVQAGKYRFDLHRSEHEVVPGTPILKLNLLESVLKSAGFFHDMGFDVKINSQPVDKMKSIQKKYWQFYNMYEKMVL